MGIEDYSSDRPDRSLSAVRNFYAGVLLLAKEVLVRAAPHADADEIIGARYKPVPDGSGGVMHAPDGHRTIDFDTIGKRFKDFKLEIDQAALGELNKIRNEIEHRFTDRPAAVVAPKRSLVPFRDIAALPACGRRSANIVRRGVANHVAGPRPLSAGAVSMSRNARFHQMAFRT